MQPGQLRGQLRADLRQPRLGDGVLDALRPAGMGSGDGSGVDIAGGSEHRQPEGALGVGRVFAAEPALLVGLADGKRGGETFGAAQGVGGVQHVEYGARAADVAGAVQADVQTAYQFAA